MSQRAEASAPGGADGRGASRWLGGAAGTGIPGLPVAATLLVFLTGLYGWSGALLPEALPDYADSPRQITGMALLLILVPSYLLGAASIGQQKSLGFVAEIRAHLAEPAEADAAADAIRHGLRRTWLPGLAFGAVMGALNTEPLDGLRGPLPILELSISFGQILMWLLIGLLLGVRITTAQAFRRLAEIVEIDLFQPDRPRAITRSGVVDVVIIAGAFLLSPLQSLDAEFRWYNYQNALLVGLPAITFFLLWPIQPLRRRHRASRDARLARVEGQIAALGPEPPATPEASARLEALLAHRDRLRNARTWPLGTALLSRVVLYLVIPPLAWAGAAVVERVVDRLLGG